MTLPWKEMCKRRNNELRHMRQYNDDLATEAFNLQEENDRLRQAHDQVIDQILDRAKVMLEEGSLNEAEFGAICAVVMVSDRGLTQEEYDAPMKWNKL